MFVADLETLRYCERRIYGDQCITINEHLSDEKVGPGIALEKSGSYCDPATPA